MPCAMASAGDAIVILRPANCISPESAGVNPKKDSTHLVAPRADKSGKAEDSPGGTFKEDITNPPPRAAKAQQCQNRIPENVPRGWILQVQSAAHHELDQAGLVHLGRALLPFCLLRSSCSRLAWPGAFGGFPGGRALGHREGSHALAVAQHRH